MFKQHPLSAAFPSMADDEFRSLRDSIEAIGVQNPITLYEGMVIDGWHRYSAANEVGTECPTVELDPAIDPRDFVLAQNKTRRHITQAQLAMATTTVYAWTPLGANQHQARVGTECRPSKNDAELAAIAGVSERTIRQSKAVQTKAAPEVLDAVRSGAIGLPKASAISKLPKEDQAAAIAKPMPKPVIESTDIATSMELLDQMAETQAENEQLLERIAIMTSDDTAREIDRLLDRIAGLEGRLQQAMSQVKASEDTTKVHAALIHKLRKLLKVEGHREIYAAVQALVAEQTEA